MPDLPTGALTFLFTDIEGSTSLWEREPGAMRAACVRHDELVEESVEAHGGTLVRPRGEGDSRFAVFRLASDAVAAACDLQRSLHAEPWPMETPIRVRVALHTGEAELREGDYYGSAVNRCARLRSVAHGGQILLSEATSALVRDALPARVTLNDLGEHRLKDLDRPEAVYQLVHPDLRSEFPPLRSLDALPNNLPAQLTSFIGREREMADVRAHLQGTRLLTLTGSGGCGKTRLSLQVAAELLEEYPDGVWLVELAALSDSALVAKAIASSLGVPEAPGTSLAQTLLEALKSRHLLLVLDNCEHLLEECARVTDALLRGCPAVKILASSREGLGIAGETTYRVPPLGLPKVSAGQAPEVGPLEDLEGYDAVRLMVERACAAQPGFRVTERNARPLVEVCRQLEGIPLAIELAAARVKVMTIEQIASRLDDAFRLLKGGSRTALPRQQTLRALIDWSYGLLNEADRALLRRLSVFMGGWTLDAAERVCAGEGIEEWEVLDLLSSLVEKSLVSLEETEGAGRYGLLETVRQYGWEKLLESGEAEAMRRRHLEFFGEVAEALYRDLTGPRQKAALERFDGEQANFRAALTWALEAGRCPDAAQALAGALARYWYIRASVAEGRQWTRAALAAQGEATTARARLLHRAAGLEYMYGNYDLCHQMREESASLSRALGDRIGLAQVSQGLALDLLWHVGDPDRARHTAEEGLAIAEEIGNRFLQAGSHRTLGIIARETGRDEEARAHLTAAVALAREIGDQIGLAVPLSHLGLLDWKRGDHAAARERFETRLAIARELGDRQSMEASMSFLTNIAISQGDYDAARRYGEEALGIQRDAGYKIKAVLFSCGHAACHQGDYAAARALFAEHLAVARERGNPAEVGDSLEGWGMVAAGCGQAARAARLFGAASALREASGKRLYEFETMMLTHQAEHHAEVRTALGDDAFAAAWAEGRDMTLDEAVAYALEEASDA